MSSCEWIGNTQETAMKHSLQVAGGRFKTWFPHCHTSPTRKRGTENRADSGSVLADVSGDFEF